jgi:predicted RNase H-like nuclease
VTDLGGSRRGTVGVDGCRAGWIAVYCDGAELAYGVFGNIAALMCAVPDASSVLIDVPIGLPWADCPVRPCDSLARRVLGGKRASSVFPAPSRAASAASSLEEARGRNLAEVGRSLSAQAWGICAKVAEVDGWLRAQPALRGRVREVHPEVCFWALNGGRPMAHSKAKRAGRDERLAVLSRYEPRVPALVSRVLAEHRRKVVQPDDVLDAAVALVTGTVAADRLEALRGEPSHDALGLPMEMVHAGCHGLVGLGGDLSRGREPAPDCKGSGHV